MKAIRNINELAKEMSRNPALVEKIKADPQKELDIIMDSPLDTDIWIYRAVVMFLGLAMTVVVFGALILTFADKAVPEVLVALGSAAVGALAGLLAPSPTRG